MRFLLRFFSLDEELAESDEEVGRGGGSRLELELFALPLAFLLEVSEEDEELGRVRKLASPLELELFAFPLAFLLEVTEEAKRWDVTESGRRGCSLTCHGVFVQRCFILTLKSSKFANLSRKLQQLAREHVYMKKYISKMSKPNGRIKQMMLI